MNGRKTAGVSGVEKLQEIEGLGSSNFAKDYPIRRVTKRGLKEFPDGDARHTVLRLPGFETDEVVLAHVDFRGVLDEQDAFVGGNEFSKDVEHGSLVGVGAITAKEPEAVLQAVLVFLAVFSGDVARPNRPSHDAIGTPSRSVRLFRVRSARPVWRRAGPGQTTAAW
jgi:hypothetical protein